MVIGYGVGEQEIMLHVTVLAHNCPRCINVYMCELFGVS